MNILTRSNLPLLISGITLLIFFSTREEPISSLSKVLIYIIVITVSGLIIYLQNKNFFIGVGVQFFLFICLSLIVWFKVVIITNMAFIIVKYFSSILAAFLLIAYGLNLAPRKSIKG